MDKTVIGGDGQFWARHFGVGIAMSILAPVLVLGRTCLSPDVQPRALSVALAVLFWLRFRLCWWGLAGSSAVGT